jgi:two-component system, LuxR family, response regulator FixJ
MARKTSSIQKAHPLIAVIDDDRSVLTSLPRLLRSAGYAAVAFSSAQEFLDAFPAQLPQCLVLDVQMPGMNGFELQSRLRELGCLVPIVFITAHDTPQTHAFVHQSGTAGLLLKPFSGASLLTAVSKAMAS